MKTRRIVIAVLFVFTYLSLNGQVFVGGDLGFSSAGGSVDDGRVTSDKPSRISFNVSPMIGKFVSERLAAGISLNFQATRTTTPGFNETIGTTSTIGVAPFLRYYAIKKDKFSVFGQGSIGFSYSDSRSKTNGISIDGPRTTVLYLNVLPGLAFDITEKISLETSINLFNLGYNLTSVKTGNIIEKTSSFGFGAGLSNLINVGNISIGAIYKF